MKYNIHSSLFRYILWIFYVGTALLLYSPMLGWTFWKDDWWFLWGSFALHPRMFTNIIQPGTVIQFLLGWNLFHAWPLPYMVFGVLLRLYVAYIFGKLSAHILSKDMRYPMMFMALMTPIGIDAVGWPSAHVTLMAAGLLLTGLSVVYSKNNHPWVGYTLFVLSFLFDPGRTIGVLIVITWVLYKQKKIQPRVIYILSGAGICIALGIMWKIRNLLSDFQVMKYVMYLEKTGSLSSLGHTWKYVFDYFASIGNLLYGSLWEFPNYLATGEYTRVIAVVGFISIVVICTFSIYILKKYHDSRPLLALTWIVIGYFIPWAFEPRITLSIYHRYMVIPGIGLLLLFGWGIDQIKIRWIKVLLVLCIVLRSAWISSHFITSQTPFRSASRSEEFYSTIMSLKSHTSFPVLIEVTGNDQFIPAALSFSGEMPLAIELRTKDFSTLPFITIDQEMLKQYMCGKKHPFAVFGYKPLTSKSFTRVHIRVDSGKPVQILDTHSVVKTPTDCQ